jgi:restriction endonuclease-like protein
VKRTLFPVHPTALRRELSQRNAVRAANLGAEMTYGSMPSVIYCEDEAGAHGNFLPASYQRILKQADWRSRLNKVYTGSRFVPRSSDRIRRELECANSSDALLMNIFCYPGMLRRPALCSLLGLAPGIRPSFGFRPRVPLKGGAQDRTEIDLKLGSLLVEAKLTEGNFQTARADLLHRYRDLDSVFDLTRLPMAQDKYRSSQLIRGALAAQAHGASFAVFCDQRRQDLIDGCFEVFSAIMSAELRCRLSVVTWQEIAAAMPRKVKTFLAEKYGISAVSTADGW